ncbi:hypothetical protein HPB47_015085, partial [Ixodes persulcatus]
VRQYLPGDLTKVTVCTTPPWRFPAPDVKLDIPGIKKKSDMPMVVILQVTMSHIYGNHLSRTHVYTDGPSTSDSSTCCVVIPSHCTTVRFKLSHITSSTMSELVAIHQALQIILTKSSNSWTIFSDSKPALQAISAFLRRGQNDQVVFEIMTLLMQ